MMTEVNGNDIDISKMIASEMEEDIQTTVEDILTQDPGEAGYDLAGIYYAFLDQRNDEEARKTLSWLKISLFSLIDQKACWDDVEKGLFLISFALRWKRGHEKLKGEFQAMLDKLERLEGEIQRASRDEKREMTLFKNDV
ncbi:MAG: hypothetical protein ACXAB4_04730 [Candidatus Hodarchaeales archaeon]|jgi:hypothetical protein